MDAPSEMNVRSNDDVRQADRRVASRTEGPSQAATDGDTTLRDRHSAVTARIAAAARSCGRSPADIALLAVSKTFDADTVLALAAAGQRAFGENYVQEALPKMAAVRDQWMLRASGRSDLPGEPPRWHFIGPIQSNKTRVLAESFDWVHSVDREKIARRLSEQRPPGIAPLQVCVQVDVSGEETKSGCAPSEAVALGAAIATMPGLQLRGVMAIPAPTDDPAQQRAQFARVRSVFEAMRAAGLPVDTLSMGMSEDLEAAIAEGATIVRVGTALFGTRQGRGNGG